MATRFYAVDYGNGAVKFTNRSDREYSIPSGYSEIYGDESMEYEGRCYTFDKTTTPVPMTERTTTEKMRICVLGAISKMLEMEDADPWDNYIVTLAVSLPLSQFTRKNMDEYIEYHKGRYEVTRQDKKYNIYINKVIPLPQGKTISVALSRDLFPPYNIIDLGYGTLEALTVELDDNNKPMMKNIIGKDIGTINLIRPIKDKLSAQDIYISESQIREVIKTGTISHRKAGIITDIVNHEAERFVNELKAELVYQKFPIDNKTVFASGGTELIGDKLNMEVDRELGRFANVKAMYKVLTIMEGR